MNKKNKGKWGEEKATQFLIRKGVKIIDRNQRTPYGELDIIAQDGEQIIFVEVKMRSSNSLGYPEDAVDYRKEQHLINSAEEYLTNHPELGENWRIDIISVEGNPQKPSVNIRWYVNAISSD